MPRPVHTAGARAIPRAAALAVAPATPTRAVAIAMLTHAVAIAVAALPSRLAAQSRPAPPWDRRASPTLAVSAAGLWSSERPDGRWPVGDGAGWEAQGMLGIGALGLGVGYQRAVQPIREAGPGAGDATYEGVFVEPRVAIAPFSNLTPYVSGRISFLRQRVPSSAQFVETRQHLTGLGAGVGVLVSVVRNAQLDLGASWSYFARDDDGRAGTLPSREEFRGGRGNGAVLRAGVVLGFDRWGR